MSEINFAAPSRKLGEVHLVRVVLAQEIAQLTQQLASLTQARSQLPARRREMEDSLARVSAKRKATIGKIKRALAELPAPELIDAEHARVAVELGSKVFVARRLDADVETLCQEIVAIQERAGQPAAPCVTLTAIDAPPDDVARVE